MNSPEKSLLSGPTFGTEQVAESVADRDPARFRIQDRVTLPSEDLAGKAIDVWCPIPPESPHQRLLDVEIDAPGAPRLGHDPEHGNRILHTRVPAMVDGEIELRLRYVVERLPVALDLSEGRDDSLETPNGFSHELGPERFVDVDDRTRELARELAGDEDHPVVLARRFYDHVVGTMAYDAEHQSWKGSTEHALVCSAGNCNDIHALFISLCRSAGIPARLVLGQALEEPAGEEEGCELCGYHCWAEFFVAGLGWVPADASCACKYGTKGLFGSIEDNHVAWSVGRDVLLAPAQRQERLLFFAGPYVEADGQRVPAVDRAVTFERVT